MTNEKIRRRRIPLLLKSILFLILVGALLFFGLNKAVEKNLTSQEEKLMIERLSSDIEYLQDIIGDGSWHIDDEGFLCRGDKRLGNGTNETANIKPFLALEDKTGTFSYVCMISNAKELTWVGDEETGYQEGHYIRVAGSTKDADGNSIVGTYIEKKVSDELDRKGSYEGAANVTGRPIFCLYKTLKNADGEVVGCVVVGRNTAELIEDASKFIRNINLSLFALLVFAAIAIFLYFKRTSDTIQRIRKYLDRIGKNDFPKEPLVVKNNDELDLVVESINEMKESLVEKERMGSELQIAADIQLNMLPSVFPVYHKSNEFDVYANMNPAKEVGGDFYDFFEVDDHQTAIVIGDVSGKGVPAALFMVIAKTLIKNYAQMGYEPEEIFTAVNNSLVEGNDAGVFVTAWMAIIDSHNGHVRYVNAGHNPPLVKRGEKFEYLDQKHGLVLAAFEGFEYKQAEFDIKDGDRIFLYTDGVTEATDSEGNLFGEERLLEFLNSRPNHPLERVIHGIHKEIDKFVGDAEQFDDITMLLYDFTKKERKEFRRIELYPTFDSMVKVANFIDSELEKFGVPLQIQRQIDIAVDELYGNIVNYAYPEKNGQVAVSIGLDDEGYLNTDKRVVKIRFVDGGKPFNPLEQEAPDTTLDADERKVGGLGVYISKSLMDDMEYENYDGFNCLTIYKVIEE